MKGKILRKILGISLAAAMIMCTGMTAGAYTDFDQPDSSVRVSSYETFGDFRYDVYDDNTVTIVKYEGNAQKLVIPQEIDGKMVKNIILLSYEEYPENFNTSVSSITLPDSIVCVGLDALKGLTEINVSPTNENHISVDGVLLSKDGSCLEAYPIAKKGEYAIPDTVREVCNTVFRKCTGLTSLIIPDSVDRLDLEDCPSLEKVYVGKRLYMVATCDDCPNLKEINVSKDNPYHTSVDGILFNKNMTILQRYPTARKGSYTIPEGVRDAWGAFEGCAGLTNITFPKGIERIGMFDGCTSLQNFIIPDGVERISSFINCTSLTELKIPKSVKKIDRYAFGGCSNLHKIIVPSTAEWDNSDRGTFENCGSGDLTLFSADEIVIGDTVTVNTSPYFNKNSDTYALLIKKKSEKKWTVKQNYSSNNIITFKPAKATDYDICVKVKDSTGKITKKFFELKVNEKLKNTSVISATTIKKGSTVTVKGSAAGGMGNYQYAVLYKKKSESKWTVRQGYKDNAEIIVRPYTNTDYDICIKVQDKDGTIAKKYFSVTVK